MPKKQSNVDRVLDIFEKAPLAEAETLLELATRAVKARRTVSLPKQIITRKPRTGKAPVEPNPGMTHYSPIEKLTTDTSRELVEN